MKTTTVLVVEDDVQLLKVITANLKERRYNVIAAKNGNEALLTTA